MGEDWIVIHGNVQPGVLTRVTTTAESSMQPAHIFIDGSGELLELYVCDQPQNNTPYGVFQSMEKPGIRLPKCVPVGIGGRRAASSPRGRLGDQQIVEGLPCVVRLLDAKAGAVGGFSRVEAGKFVVGYSFDLTTNELTPEYADNPDAGKAHPFVAYRVAGAGGPAVRLKAAPPVQGVEGDEDDD